MPTVVNSCTPQSVEVVCSTCVETMFFTIAGKASASIPVTKQLNGLALLVNVGCLPGTLHTPWNPLSVNGVLQPADDTEEDHHLHQGLHYYHLCSEPPNHKLNQKNQHHYHWKTNHQMFMA